LTIVEKFFFFGIEAVSSSWAKIGILEAKTRPTAKREHQSNLIFAVVCKSASILIVLIPPSREIVEMLP